MVEMLKSLITEDMFSDSLLPGIRFFRCDHDIARTPLVYDPGIFIVAQGIKIGYLRDQKFQYDSNNYLVTSVPIPFECETFACPEEPFLGLLIDIDIPTLHELIGIMEQDNISVQNEEKPNCVGPAVLDGEMEDAVLRLLRSLKTDSESKILGPGLKKEILYRALLGTQASSLYALASLKGSFARISHALRSIHGNYSSKLDVNKLADSVNMSVSTFHRAFKEVTSESPVQYLKKIRLSKARDLIEDENVKVNMAAHLVGYESPSQFSREYKRHFGSSPTGISR
jgi:AraC-like DNA-binding protein